jgi:hypothetical protein
VSVAAKARSRLPARSSGRVCVSWTPRAATCQPPHIDMHALEDLSVSGCDRARPDFLHSSSSACVRASWTPRAATCQPSPDMHALEDLCVAATYSP